MARENQPVIFGIVPLSGVFGWLGFNHWALKVGEVWHEVGAGPDSNTGHIDAASDLRIKNIVGEYKIRTNTGDRATSGAEPTPINYDLWLTNLFPLAFLIGVILWLALWALGVPLFQAAVLGLILPFVTQVPRLENFCRQVKEQLGVEVTCVAGGAGLSRLVVALDLGAWWLAGMFGLLAVWWLCRVKGPELLHTWQGTEPSRNFILGTTRRTEEEIAQFDELFEIENPKYLGLSTNCQRYVRDLFAFLMEPPHGEKTGDLPPPQSIGSLFKESGGVSWWRVCYQWGSGVGKAGVTAATATLLVAVWLFATYPGGPPLTPPQVLVLTSSGPAVEWQGDATGEFVKEVGGLHDGVSYWRQRHTVDGEGKYLYRTAGKWKVGPTLGGTTAAVLSAPCSSTPARPPTEGWSYNDEEEWVSDPSLRCLPPSGPSCTRLEVSLEGRAGQVRGSCRGSYREMAGVYSAGRKVFQQEGGQGRVLMVKAGMTDWSISDSVDAATAGITSGAASICPADPRARSSQRFNVKNWRFYDGEDWVEGGVSVECDRHSWRQ